MSEPREYTRDEIKKMFVTKMWQTLEYCLKDERMKTSQHKLEVFMHSTLATLDGCGIDLPAFIIAPLSTEEDKQFYISEGENFYPINDQEKIKCDIAGGLHEIMYSLKPASIPERD